MSIKVISNWYAAQYMLLCSVFKENIRRMDVCVADHSLTEFYIVLLNRGVYWVHKDMLNMYMQWSCVD